MVKVDVANPAGSIGFYVQRAAHTVAQGVYKAGVETVKIVAATVILERGTKSYLFPRAAQSLHQKIVTTVIIAPLFEEVLFRGVIQEGIFHNLQRFKNRFISKKVPSAADLKAQEVFRVRLSAIIFGAAHLFNPHTSAAGAMIQFTLATMGGLSYGYLQGKYNTLALGILAHGFNNTFAVLSAINARKADKMLVAVNIVSLLALDIFWYVLGTTNIIEGKFKQIGQEMKRKVENIFDRIEKRLDRFEPVKMC